MRFQTSLYLFYDVLIQYSAYIMSIVIILRSRMPYFSEKGPRRLSFSWDKFTVIFLKFLENIILACSNGSQRH